MLPVVHIGPLALQTPGLIILLGVGLGLSLTERQAARYQLNGGTLYNMAFVSLLAGIVSARLAYVAHYPSAFASNPGSLVSLNLNLFEPLWGIIFGLLTSSLYAWRKKLPLLHTLDALTSGFAFFAIAIHLAHFASGDAYGTPTNLPWAIELWGTRRHPVQIYEFVAAIFIFGLVWPRPAWFRIAGQRFIVFIALSAGARLFMEAFRDDGTLWGRYRSAQVIAWMLLAICLWIYKKSEENI